MNSRIDRAFGRLQKAKKKALIAYITAGFPSRKSFRPLVHTLEAAGVDLLEIGVPFSDPIADGPTIQHSSQVALENGVTLKWILESIKALRRENVQLPLILMSYCNPIRAMGVNQFFQRAQAAGADGLIIPDIIPEEGEAYSQSAKRHDIDLIYLVSPTTPRARLRQVADKTQGFLYAVSQTGVTGARTVIPEQVKTFLRSVKAVSKKPVAVGFGLSTPAQVRKISPYADGVILGSAYIRVIEKSKGSRFQGVSQFTRSLKGALHAS